MLQKQNMLRKLTTLLLLLFVGMVETNADVPSKSRGPQQFNFIGSAQAATHGNILKWGASFLLVHPNHRNTLAKRLYAPESRKRGGKAWLFFVFAFLALVLAFLTAFVSFAAFSFLEPALGIIFLLQALGCLTGAVLFMTQGFKRAKHKKRALLIFLGIILAITGVFFIPM